ncbi:hypothetical protein C8F01DRAFT_1109445 [Mycena amicta]|nr:hypothetical protein C8F01DRAFT_1109445 [Mycena amicta]
MQATRLYSQDIVRVSDAPLDNAATGVVMRCWHDPEDVAPHSDPLMRPLLHGEVGVSFYRERATDSTLSNREFDRQILPESQLQLVDRSFHPGDFCKRAVEDTHSGVVLNARVQGRCAHVITGERIEGWVTLEQLSDRDYAEVGDLVILDDWIGQPFKLYDEVLVETSGGEIVRLPEIGSRLSVGERGADILPPPASAVHSIFGFILGNTGPASSNDTCVQVTHTVYAITWLAISQALDSEEAAKRRRPPQFWKGPDMSKLTLLRSLADLEIRVGDRVTFKDDVNIPSSTHGLDGATKIVVKTFAVTETQTFIDVLWQDGTREAIRSTEVIPYLNPDEYDCWPGDWVVWNREDERRPVIVQSVNALQRTASVLVPETGKIELASVLELDTHGASDALMLETDLGVRRGDFVFVHPEGRTNGASQARVPHIGEVESWVRDAPFVDNQLAGFRKDMSEIGADIARRRGSEAITEGRILRPSADNETLMWIGEVQNVCLDGTVDITHPNGSQRNYPLNRLTKLYDGIDQLEDGMWDEMSEEHHPPEDDGHWDWETDSGSADDWGSNSYEAQIEVHDDQQTALVEDDDFALAWPDSIGLSESDIDTPRQEIDPLGILHPDVPKDAADDPLLLERGDEEDDSWKRFEILPSAPYSVLVRAYEDRVDLLRCMIIGSENTPYADAPFVLDWMLDSNFPHSPPMAHFLSWTNGNGRGKVCLSILGTWAGDKNEIWNSARSSLLQAFVSIQGLVLVKEPWFCEPAYEKLRGTEEGIVNSRLYSEKAYVLSRGFVRRALELPPGGLEAEIEWLFYRSGRLEKVIEDAQNLIQKSRANEAESEEDRELAVPRLSAGGIITLDRTLTKLINLRRS